MSDVYVIGVSCTAFGKRPDASFRDLTREAYEAVLRDAAMDDGGAIESSWFGNCGMGAFGQQNIRGQVCFTPLVREHRFPERVPMINVEGGCATASMAFNGAWKDVLSGQAGLSLAIGVEKTYVEGDPARTQSIFAGGIDQIDPQEWHAYYLRAGEEAGKPFAPGAGGGTGARAHVVHEFGKGGVGRRGREGHGAEKCRKCTAAARFGSGRALEHFQRCACKGRAGPRIHLSQSSLRTTRKPYCRSRVETDRRARLAARSPAWLLLTEPPRTTRRLQSPAVTALPSTGASL